MRSDATIPIVHEPRVSWLNPPVRTVAIGGTREALRDFSRKHRGGADELARCAHIFRVSCVMQPYMDAIA